MRKSTNKFEIVGDILKITTASGTLILADANEYDLLRKYSWCISRTGYAGNYTLIICTDYEDDDLRYYFDFEAYGRDMDINGHFIETDSGYIEIFN